MRVQCIHNKGRELGNPEAEAMYSEGTSFALKIGKYYSVFGLGLHRSTLAALVFDESHGPSFLPAGLFEFETEEMPGDWEFTVLDGAAVSAAGESPYWSALWGYPELVGNHSHASDLASRDRGALDVFYLQLARESKDVLGELIQKRLPQMLDLVPLIGTRPFEQKEKEAIHVALVEELDARGAFRSGEASNHVCSLNELLERLPYL